MKGISQQKAKENSIKYKSMYDKWSSSETTLEELGKEYDITKQRMWQIITRCKLGGGDYYQGVQLARNKWSELNSIHTDFDDIIPAYNTWLSSQGIKTARNNQSVIPHTGWDWKY
tara:strand:- start:2268 stop:2612 length:345 start_codon:yes stop_codon:yes gene_type:complete